MIQIISVSILPLSTLMTKASLNGNDFKLTIKGCNPFFRKNNVMRVESIPIKMMSVQVSSIDKERQSPNMSSAVPVLISNVEKLNPIIEW